MKLMEKYKHKIKTPVELQQLLGKCPREKKVIMCHGVFDVVHPGHVRHLLYAKSKGDILIASLTADKHINKGKYRPHVPQDLRAVNLAAFEMIDYVVIDKNATPIENIKLIQPDYYAKGYEYCANGKPIKTHEEEQILETFGGQIIFTPGDIVYSSSKFIEAYPPSLHIEKLCTLMERSSLEFKDLLESLDKIKGKTVHVVGDTIIDSYTQTTMIGGQTKTPTMSVLYQSKEDYVGGAGIVAKHLKAAGAYVIFSTVLGNDSLKDFALKDLVEFGIEVNAIIDSNRPTTNKNAIVTGGYRLLKIDTLDNSSISDKILDQLKKSIANTKCDLVMFSDFRHGIFNKRTIPFLIDAIPNSVFKVADSQVASRWGNITEFKEFDLITPNEREARFSLADQDSGIRPLAANLYNKAKCKNLILKLGDKGILTCKNQDQELIDSYFVLDSFVTNLVDAVGSGDALLAYASLALCSGLSEEVASIIGSLAAACECEKDGNIPIYPEDLIKKINNLDIQSRYQPHYEESIQEQHNLVNQSNFHKSKVVEEA